MVGKDMILSSSRFADASRTRSNDCKDILGELRRYERRQKKIIAVDDSETLSDIDDEELGIYINSKEEMECKKALWEEIYREQMKMKKCNKRAAETKKAGPVKKASKVTDEAENEEVNKARNEKRRSAKINYDALEKLEAELEQLGNEDEEK